MRPTRQPFGAGFGRSASGASAERDEAPVPRLRRRGRQVRGRPHLSPSRAAAKAVPLDRLHPAPLNPRTIKDERFQNLVRSIQADPDFPWRRPILATADWRIGVIVGPSGSGSSSLRRLGSGDAEVYGEPAWPEDAPIIDAVAEQLVKLLGELGLAVGQDEGPGLGVGQPGDERLEPGPLQDPDGWRHDAWVADLQDAAPVELRAALGCEHAVRRAREKRRRR